MDLIGRNGIPQAGFPATVKKMVGCPWFSCSLPSCYRRKAITNQRSWSTRVAGTQPKMVSLYQFSVCQHPLTSSGSGVADHDHLLPPNYEFGDTSFQLLVISSHIELSRCYWLQLITIGNTSVCYTSVVISMLVIPECLPTWLVTSISIAIGYLCVVISLLLVILPRISEFVGHKTPWIGDAATGCPSNYGWMFLVGAMTGTWWTNPVK